MSSPGSTKDVKSLERGRTWIIHEEMRETTLFVHGPFSAYLTGGRYWLCLDLVSLVLNPKDDVKPPNIRCKSLVTRSINVWFTIVCVCGFIVFCSISFLILFISLVLFHLSGYRSAHLTPGYRWVLCIGLVALCGVN